jgi:hypothetical protein
MNLLPCRREPELGDYKRAYLIKATGLHTNTE